MMPYKNIEETFLYSALTEENPFISTEKAVEWVRSQNEAVRVKVKKIQFDQLKNWELDIKSGSLKHCSGQFFSIQGINVKTNWGKVNEWEQPIINQPEVGYLGIVTKEFNGILYFLLQAKVEPGNVNNVQLSPTLQATRSNYSQIHSGRKPLYLEYFQNAKKEQILLDQLQSEQGARFLKKRNRNMIIKVDEDIHVKTNFIWLTLGQIKKLINIDNFINMDTRTVISGISFGDKFQKTINSGSILKERINFDMIESSTNVGTPKHSFDEIIMWLTNLKCSYDLEVNTKSLFETSDWVINSSEIYHKNNNFFKIIATKVEISNREVNSWYQPLMEPVNEGIVAFIYKNISGVPHFLIQAKLECGNFDILEMAPTVQCITGSYENSKEIPFLDYVLKTDKSRITHDSLQSEEGGRFYHEQNRHLIVEADEDFAEDIPSNYIWVTLKQLNTFLKFNNYLNIQARSLISTIQLVK
jgi:dTDP-4-dehydro-6-deoxy-alpha-D-glucopyranose 2,3-dehydratase